MASSPVMAPPEAREVTLALFGGRKTDVIPSDLPEGLTPDEQDGIYVPGGRLSRPGLSRLFVAGTLTAGASVLYEKTYVQPNDDPLTLLLTSDGKLWVEDVGNNPLNPTSIAQFPAGLYAQSVSEFGREYIAFSDLLHGQDVPIQYDGTNLDRVTMDGPGAGPTVSNVAPATATLSNSGAGAGYAITSVTPSDPKTITVPFFQNGIWTTQTLTYYSTLTVVAAVNPLAGGDVVSLSGITPSIFDASNKVVTAVLSTTTFKISFVSLSSAGGTGGTATVENPTLVRLNGIVTANSAAPHGFQVGWQVQISGINNTDLGGGIASISRDNNGVVTVTTTDPHGLSVNDTIAIAGVTNPDDSFNVASTQVNSVLGPTVFTYLLGGTPEVSTGASGNVQDIWNTTAFIQSVPSPTTFTYQNQGPNDLVNDSGTATILGQISPGTHQLVVMWITRQGAIPAPSPPVQFVANGGQQALLTEIPIGPANVVARLIGATGAGGDNYFTLAATPQVAGQVTGTSLLIPDNTSTSALIDFSDNTLFAGIPIDQIGNDLFDQIVLGPVAGFFAYASRLACWGDFNKIENFLNMGFSGGYVPSVVSANAGAGASSGGGTAWSNPTNVESPTNYADCSVAAHVGSANLQISDFNFSATGTPETAQPTFQYYFTGGSGIGQPFFIVQLLKAGVPFGNPQNVFLSALNPGTSASPLQGTFTLSAAGLHASDVNATGFGFQITIPAGNALHLFVRAASIQVTSIPAVPAGWSSINSTSVTGALIPTIAPTGVAYQMTSAGGAFDCLISQPAYQDAFGDNILTALTNYFWFVKVSAEDTASGNLVAEFYSPTVGSLAIAVLPAAPLSVNTEFLQQNYSAELPATIPPDTVFRIYLQNVNAGGVVTIYENLNVFADNPYRDNLSRWSYVDNPEGFAQTTGNLGPEDDESPIRCFALLRQSTLLETAEGIHDFTDNTSEPDEWNVNQLTRATGTLSLRGGDPGKFGTGDAAEDWAIIASKNGVYMHAGGEFWKVSQEVSRGALPQAQDPRPCWDDINWAAEQTVVAKNDPASRRAYFAVPINGALTPNVVFALDYREMDTASQIAAAPPLHITIQGKMKTSDLTRKWSLWNVSANDMEILIRPGNQHQIYFAGGNTQAFNPGVAFGNIYSLNPLNLTDDDYGAIGGSNGPYYTTYAFTDHDQEQALGLGADSKLVKQVHAYVTGVGLIYITPIVTSLYNFKPSLSPRILVSDTDISNFLADDLEWTTVGLRGDRIYFRISVSPLPGATDVQMRLQKFIVHMMKDPVAVFRQSGV